MKELTITPKNNSKYRVLFSSDIHCNDLQTWYGVSNADRMQHWVNCVKAEHEKHPIDLLLLLGDFSLDHWMYGGQWLKTGKSGTKEFFDSYLSQIGDIPWAAVSGNHEQFSASMWKTITGGETECAVVLGDTVFLLFDTFSGELDPDHDHDGCYIPQDAKKVAALIERYSGKQIYLASHWFDADKESDEFCALVANTPEIKGIFSGHTHYCTVIDRPDRFGNKQILQTGNFSYTSQKETESTFWGFRDLILSQGAAVSEYIVVESNAAPSGTMMRIPYQKNNRCILT